MLRTLIALFVALCFLISGETCRGQVKDANLKKLLQSLEKSKEQFSVEKDKAKAAALKDFSAAISAAANDTRRTVSERLAASDRLQRLKEQFDSSERLPDDLQLTIVGWKYGVKLVKSFKAVSNQFEITMKESLKQNEIELARSLAKDKEKFANDQFPARMQFATGAFFRGSRYFGAEGNSAVPFEFRVTSLENGLFEARAAQNVGVANNPVFKLSGSLDGIHVICKSLDNVQGGMRLYSCEGILVGPSLILELTTANGNGTKNSSYAVLRR